jgi:hypothetical protein
MIEPEDRIQTGLFARPGHGKDGIEVIAVHAWGACSQLDTQ